MESLRFGCARSWVRFPLFPFVFFAFFGLSALYPTGSDRNPAQRARRASGVRTRTTGVVVVGVGAGLASPQRSGDARPTSDGGLASPQPSRNRHMLRDDEASGRRRARLFSIVGRTGRPARRSIDRQMILERTMFRNCIPQPNYRTPSSRRPATKSATANVPSAATDATGRENAAG